MKDPHSGALGDLGGDRGVGVVLLFVAPAVEVEIDSCLAGVVADEHRPAIANPQVIQRCGNQFHIGSGQLARQFDLLRSHQHRHRFELCDGLGDRTQILLHLSVEPPAPDLVAGAEGHPGSQVWFALVGHAPGLAVAHLAIILRLIGSVRAGSQCEARCYCRSELEQVSSAHIQIVLPRRFSAETSPSGSVTLSCRPPTGPNGS